MLSLTTAILIITTIGRKRVRTVVLYFLHVLSSGLLVVAYGTPFLLGVPILLFILIIGTHIVPVYIALSVPVVWVGMIKLLSRYTPIWENIPAVPFSLELMYISAIAIVGPSLIDGVRMKRRLSIALKVNRSLETSVNELSAANMSYNTFIQMAELQAARHERSRITREIHDGVGYALTNLIMLAESAHDLVPTGDIGVAEKFVTIRNQARVALSDTRRALRELREAEQGLLFGQDALSHMMDVFEQATGVQTTREFLAPEGVLRSDRVFPVVYRLVQEALTNSFRHGRATHVRLRIWLAEGTLIVSVNDNGNAPPTIAEGIGLQGMRERLGEVGGELSYHSIKGFTVIARIPFRVSEVPFA